MQVLLRAPLGVSPLPPGGCSSIGKVWGDSVMELLIKCSAGENHQIAFLDDFFLCRVFSLIMPFKKCSCTAAIVFIFVMGTSIQSTRRSSWLRYVLSLREKTVNTCLPNILQGPIYGVNAQ